MYSLIYFAVWRGAASIQNRRHIVSLGDSGDGDADVGLSRIYIVGDSFVNEENISSKRSGDEPDVVFEAIAIIASGYAIPSRVVCQHQQLAAGFMYLK